MTSAPTPRTERARAGRWAAMLARWEIPAEIRDAAPASPYFFDPEVFARAADEAVDRVADSPSDEVARDALPGAGSVLDVGCGAGAASLRLRPRRLVGVDSNVQLLDAFVDRAGRMGLQVTAVEGRWPDVSTRCPPADVVVCHHVIYNVPDLAAFATALDAHARARVVIESTTVHPMTWTAPYWQELHGLVQPDGPTIEDALDVLVELGLDVHEQRWRRSYQPIGEQGPHAFDNVARRLCLQPARHEELRLLLEKYPPPTDREVVTLWW